MLYDNTTMQEDNVIKIANNSRGLLGELFDIISRLDVKLSEKINEIELLKQDLSDKEDEVSVLSDKVEDLKRDLSEAKSNEGISHRIF